ncbi:junctional adhesion molecule-like isoform X2 [Silurus meridionalis]|uniref:junctional adhesion molecule-like isoform X2 n=1 Tax=Silurus meridionalis TaxID=175797 RepID=UPI001EEA6304|nr:junctional adhesion molecule-like isoform X2 [Silurus meridionalis]
MMKCLYLLSVVFHVAAGCALSGEYNTEITQHKGGSVLLPCSCSDLLSKPQKLTWETFRTGRLTEVLNDEHYRGRYQLFNNISPANLSLLISDLREEDQGVYRCSTEKEHRDFSLYVKGCELVKKTGVEEVTGFIGESVVLPCVCTDLQDDPKRVTWKFNKNNHFQEIYSKQTGNHSNRVKLVSKNPPGNLSLLISDLTEEDQGTYTCSAQADHRNLRLSFKGRRETSTQSRKTDKTPPSEQPQSKTTTSPPSSSTTQGKQPTSTTSRTTDTTRTSVHPQSTTTKSPASSSTTPEQVNQSSSLLLVFGIVAVLLLVIPGVVVFICWRHRAGRSGENMITEGCLDRKGNQKDQNVPDVTYSTVSHVNTAGAARVQIIDGDETEYARIITN